MIEDEYEAEEERAERFAHRLADMRPFVTGLLHPDDAAAMLAGHAHRLERPCPFCLPDVVTVTVTRRAKGWHIRHPLPYCPQYARYAEAV